MPLTYNSLAMSRQVIGVPSDHARLMVVHHRCVPGQLGAGGEAGVDRRRAAPVSMMNARGSALCCDFSAGAADVQDAGAGRVGERQAAIAAPKTAGSC